MAKKLFARYRKELNPANPGWLGKTIFLAVSLPVSLSYALVIGLFMFLLLFGIDSSPMVIDFSRDSTTALSPVVAVLLGIWLLHAYLYLAFLFIPLSLILGVAVIDETLDDVLRAYVSLQNRVIAVWSCFAAISCASKTAVTLTEPLKLATRCGIPLHQAGGWQASRNPMLA